jgi:hypothetical protein
LARLHSTPGGAEAIDGTIHAVALDLAAWPVPRLQTLPGAIKPFLWPVHPSWPAATNNRVPISTFELDTQRLPVLSLFPGVAEILIRTGGLLKPHIEAVWTQQVADWNRLRDLNLALQGHLFPGAVRASWPAELRPVLFEVQNGRCLWCGDRLKVADSHVDHVVPWSECRNDSLENLVLADRGCNISKLQWLVSPRLLEGYAMHLERIGGALDAYAAQANWFSDMPYSVAVLEASYRVVTRGLRKVWEPGGGKGGQLIDLEIEALSRPLARLRAIRQGR